MGVWQISIYFMGLPIFVTSCFTEFKILLLYDSLGVCDTSVWSNMIKYKCDVVTEKLILKTHYLTIWILSLLFWLLISGHTDFEGFEFGVIIFFGRERGGGKVIEIYARKNINAKEIRLSIPPLGRLYLGRWMAFSGHFTVKIYDGTIKMIQFQLLRVIFMHPSWK